MPHWLFPPAFPDEEQARVAGLLNLFIWTIEFVVVFDAALLFVLAPETLPTFWINGLLFVLVLGIRALMVRGWVRLASFLLCFVVWILLSYYFTISNGLDSPALGFLGLVVIMSTILLSGRGTAFFGVLSGITLVGLYMAGNAGILVSEEAAPTLERLFGTNAAIICALTGFAAVGSRSISNALSRSRRSERALNERNGELQREIAARKKAEEERARLANIVETTLDFVGMADRKGKVLYLNQGARKLLGLPGDVEIGQTAIADYHPPEKAKMLIEQAVPTAAQHGTWTGENILLTYDKREVPVSQIVLAHRTETGDVVFYSTIMRDISEHKQAEQQRLQLALEHERLLVFKEFLSKISHDLKTPLTILNTSLYLIEKISDPVSQKRQIDLIRDQTQLLEKYILDILTVSRLEQVPDLVLESLALGPLLERVVARLRPAAHDKDLTLSVEITPGLPQIRASSEELIRALTNLVENAVVYTLRGGSVSVRASCEASEVVISVSDTGIGIEVEALPHIFERYYRTSKARKLGAKGTGLGLAIVKKIVEMHHGRIEVQSVLGAGSTFRVCLPSAPNGTGNA